MDSLPKPRTIAGRQKNSKKLTDGTYGKDVMIQINKLFFSATGDILNKLSDYYNKISRLNKNFYWSVCGRNNNWIKIG